MIHVNDTCVKLKIMQEDKEKQEKYSEQDFNRDRYLTSILEEFAPADVR